MKVYRVHNDVNRYQYFLTQREEDIFSLKMNCVPKATTWQPPKVILYKPKHIAGDFYHFASDILITNVRATEALQDFLEMAGELLPLPYEGEEFTLLNVTVCIHCLDHEKTEWLIDEATGNKVLPLKYVFHKNNFTRSRFFKIPETSGGQLLVVDLDQGDDEEVRGVVRLAELKGLVFEKLWDEKEVH